MQESVRNKEGDKRPFLPYNRQLNLFLLPYLIGSLLLVLIPALITLVAAFTDYDLVATPVWVGLENFRRLFQSAFVRTGLENSIFFIALAVPLRLLGAVANSDHFLDPAKPPANSRVYIDTVPQLGRVPVMKTWAIIEEAASNEIENAFYGQYLSNKDFDGQNHRIFLPFTVVTRFPKPLNFRHFQLI